MSKIKICVANLPRLKSVLQAGGYVIEQAEILHVLSAKGVYCDLVYTPQTINETLKGYKERIDEIPELEGYWEVVTRQIALSEIVIDTIGYEI